MIWYPFRRQAAWNSVGDPVQSGSGAVYAVADTTFSTPLTVRPVGGGVTSTTVTIDDFLSHEFEVEDHEEVYWKSGALPPVHLFSAIGMRDDTRASAADAEAARVAAEAAAAAATGPADTTVATLLDTTDSATRVQVDELIGAVNVLKAGATGDGVTNDGPALAAAIATAGTLGFRKVFLPPGTYLTSQKLTIPTGTTIVGVPGRTVVKAAAGSTASPLLFEVTGAADVAVYGVTFDGNTTGVTNFNNVCVVFSSTRVRFDECRWQNTRGIGVIFSTDVSHSGVSRSHFREVGSRNKTTGLNADRRQAIAFSSGSKANNRGNYVTGCTFEEVGLDCVSMSSQDSGLIAHNTVYGNYAGALYVSGCSDTKVIGNHVEGGDLSGNGVDVFSSDTVTVVGNTVRGRGGAGIMLADTADSTVAGNVCLNNFRSNGAASESAHQAGITIFGQASVCSNVTISGNVCTDTQGTKTQKWGVQVSNHAHTNIWIDSSNRLTGNATADVGGGGPVPPYTRTPTWINYSGNGTVNAHSSVSRIAVVESGILTIGSTTGLAGSSLFIGLPATPAATTNSVVGTFMAIDNTPSANTARKAGVILRSGSSGLFVFYDGTTVTSTSPFTWATGDQLVWSLNYVPA